VIVQIPGNGSTRVEREPALVTQQD